MNTQNPRRRRLLSDDLSPAGNSVAPERVLLISSAYSKLSTNGRGGEMRKETWGAASNSPVALQVKLVRQICRLPAPRHAHPVATIRMLSDIDEITHVYKADPQSTRHTIDPVRFSLVSVSIRSLRVCVNYSAMRSSEHVPHLRSPNT
jgi:hypothetical protein